MLATAHDWCLLELGAVQETATLLDNLLALVVHCFIPILVLLAAGSNHLQQAGTTRAH